MTHLWVCGKWTVCECWSNWEEKCFYDFILYDLFKQRTTALPVVDLGPLSGGLSLLSWVLLPWFLLPVTLCRTELGSASCPLWLVPQLREGCSPDGTTQPRSMFVFQGIPAAGPQSLTGEGSQGLIALFRMCRAPGCNLSSGLELWEANVWRLSVLNEAC